MWLQENATDAKTLTTNSHCDVLIGYVMPSPVAGLYIIRKLLPVRIHEGGHTMKHCLAVNLFLPLVASALLLEVQGMCYSDKLWCSSSSLYCALFFFSSYIPPLPIVFLSILFSLFSFLLFSHVPTQKHLSHYLLCFSLYIYFLRSLLFLPLQLPYSAFFLFISYTPASLRAIISHSLFRPFSLLIFSLITIFLIILLLSR